VLGYLDEEGVERFCCLGVLCELAVEAGVLERADVPDSVDTVFEYGEAAAQDLLPDEVLYWAGLTSMANPTLGEFSAAGWNDNGSTFAEIADLIEEHL
jgi:hypothetical protein